MPSIPNSATSCPEAGKDSDRYKVADFISNGVSRWDSAAAGYGLFRPRPSVVVVPAAAAYAATVSSPNRSASRSVKLPA